MIHERTKSILWSIDSGLKFISPYHCFLLHCMIHLQMFLLYILQLGLHTDFFTFEEEVYLNSLLWNIVRLKSLKTNPSHLLNAYHLSYVTSRSCIHLSGGHFCPIVSNFCIICQNIDRVIKLYKRICYQEFEWRLCLTINKIVSNF